MKNVKNVNELQNAVIEFLKGKRKTTFWHLAPIDDETYSIVKKLVEINSKGFITIEGQPGTCKSQHHYETKEPYEEKQRGYVSGFMRNKQAEKFIEKIKDNNKILYYSEKLNGINHNISTDYFEENDEDSDNIYDQKISLTEEIGTTFHNKHTSFLLPDLPGQMDLSLVFRENKELAEKMRKELTYLTLIRKDFCETDLEDIVDEILTFL